MMSRYLVFIAFSCACHSSSPDNANDAAIDAAGPCARAAPTVPSGAVANGLMAVDLTGTWTFNGSASTSTGTAPATFVVQLARNGSGWCEFQVGDPHSDYTDQNGYIDDTQGDSDPASIDHVLIYTATDGTLAFHEEYSDGGEGPTSTYEAIGTLTH